MNLFHTNWQKQETEFMRRMWLVHVQFGTFMVVQIAHEKTVRCTLPDKIVFSGYHHSLQFDYILKDISTIMYEWERNR